MKPPVNMIFRFLLILLSIFQLFPVASQSDSILQELINYPPLKSELISRGRRALMDHLLADNLQKTEKLKDYLMESVSNTEYMAFYPAEYWLISFWTADYADILAVTIDFNEIDLRNSILPPSDPLTDKLIEKSLANQSALKFKLQHTASVDPEQKEFLGLLLDYLLSKDTNDAQELINNQADNFLQAYPTTRYESFVRKYVRFRYRPSRWAFAFDFGLGHAYFTQELHRHFRSSLPISLGIDVQYKKFITQLRILTMTSRLRTDILWNNITWPARSKVNTMTTEISAGYALVEQQRFRIFPLAGISWTGIYPLQEEIKKNPELENVEMKMTFGYTFGLNAEVRLGHALIPLVSRGPEERYRLLRLRYAFFIPHFYQKYNAYNGSLHAITLSYGLFGRSMKRDY